MNVQLLIDALVRQTMVLIAELATTGGNRAPLASVADQVFRDLTSALEEQGVRRKVAADMFGLALRSYQQKVQRLSESASDRGRSLWEAVHTYLQDKQVVRRADLLRRFARDDAASVAGVVDDMVDSGLVYRTGRGDETVLRVAPREEVGALLADADAATIDAVLWSTIYRDGPLTEAELDARVKLDAAALRAALTKLLDEKRIVATGEGEAARYESRKLWIPLGDPNGWEASLLNHYQAVVAAICAKLRNGDTRAEPDDQLGGSTFSFDVWRGHPHEMRVRGLLARHRAELADLWNDVTAHNGQAIPRDGARVTFYFGQSVIDRPASDVGEQEEEK